MCDKAVDDCLWRLKFIHDWFVTSEMLEKLDNALHANDEILFYSEYFVKVTFIACHWKIFLMHILLKLVLIMTIILIKMLLLFMLDVWLGVVNLENAGLLKKDKQINNAYNVVSQMMVEFLLVRTWE